MTRRRFSLFSMAVICLVYICLAVPKVSAHGVGYQIIESDGCQAAEFGYSSGEPMAYAKILVFGPKDEKVEYQNGRTDRQGRFAFVPDGPGEWRVEANDGQGHKVTVRIQIASKAESGEHAAAEPLKSDSMKSGNNIPVSVAALLGVSVIVNVFFGLNYFKKRGLP